MTPAEKILSRADGVRHTGNGRWMFKHPTRDQRTGSVSLRELPDGKVLLHDFGGDDVAAIVEGLGLTMGDLFPEPLAPTDAPRRRSLIRPDDALRILAGEANLVAVAAGNLAFGATLTDADRQRLTSAAGRIQVICRECAL